MHSLRNTGYGARPDTKRAMNVPHFAASGRTLAKARNCLVYALCSQMYATSPKAADTSCGKSEQQAAQLPSSVEEE